MLKFTRKCPICESLITYSNKYSFKNAELKKTNCKSCSVKNSITDERRKEMSERVKGENNPMYGKYGELNPFFGKNHSEESKEKIKNNKDYSTYKTKEFKEKISNLVKGNKNPMYGRTFYDIWVKKYGKEIADNKLKEFKKKQSILNSGVNNSMYGKPSPKGSGNGWSGWYNGWFFRSLKELSYMINVIERFNLSWTSAENNNFKIYYKDYKGNDRTYTADFIIEGKYMVEIKPKKLWNSDVVNRKRISAKKYCEENNLIYKIRDISPLSFEELNELYSNNKIKFTERYEKRFLEYSKNL